MRFYKAAKRRMDDISTVVACFAVDLDTAGRVRRARFAYGGVAPTVVRLPKTEAFLTGKAPSGELFLRAGELARSEVKPITDVRASADYRLQLAENILSKFWYETFP